MIAARTPTAMRQQDSLLKLCPPRSPLLAQYVAREIEGLPLYFDAHETAQALRTIARDQGEPGAAQAVLALRRLSPAYCLRERAQPGTAARSRLLSEAELDRLEAGPDQGTRLAGEASRQTVRRALALVLEPMVEPLLLIVRTASGPRRRAAMSALARIGHKKAAAALRAIARAPGDPDAAVAAMLAVGFSTETTASEALEAARAQQPTPLFPGTLVALGAAPGPHALELLGVLAQKGPKEALPGIAAAAEGFEPQEASELLRYVIRRGHGWATASALVSLGRQRTPRALEQLQALYGRLDHPTLKAHCIQAAAAAGGARARAFLADVLEDRLDDAGLARTLEGLVRVADNLEEHSALLSRYAGHANPQVAAPAVLGLTATDPEAARRALERWLTDADPLWRAEAAYCLGYVSGEGPAILLRKLALSDPEDAVRLQAVRALALQGWSSASVASLLLLLAQGQEPVRVVAAQALGDPDLAEDKGVLATLSKASADGSEAACWAARALGRLRSPAGAARLRELLREPAGPELQTALLEGLDLCGAVEAETVSQAERLAQDGPPGVRAAAMRVLWHAGQVEAVAALAPMLSGGPEESATALAAIETMAVSAEELIPAGALPALQSALQEMLRSRDYREFAAAELSVHVTPERLPRGFDVGAAARARRRARAQELAGLASDGLQRRIDDAMRKSRAREPGEAAFDPLGLDAAPPTRRGPGRVATAALAVAALAALAWGVASPPGESAADAGRAARPAALQISGLPGGAILESPGKGASRAMPASLVRPGTRARSGPSRPLELAAPAGRQRIVLSPGSSVQIDEVFLDPASDASRVSLSGLQGSLQVSLQGDGTECRVRAGGCDAVAYPGLSYFRAGAGGLVLQVAGGRAEIQCGRSAGPLLLTAGQQAEVGPSGPGAVTPFDPASAREEPHAGSGRP